VQSNEDERFSQLRGVPAGLGLFLLGRTAAITDNTLAKNPRFSSGNDTFKTAASRDGARG
jgi:hypothetical protein